ncbi:MAG: ubiquinol-cytochrome C chaperone family protein [Hyphomicrobium sp.]
MSWFSSKSDAASRAAELYGTVVAQARLPHFYSECGIADTPEGRYELIVLHLFLLADRLRLAEASAGAGAEDIARRTLETFVVDMDDNLREMGVGDLSVPKKVKRAAAAFYERASAYREALDSPAAGDSEPSSPLGPDARLVAALGAFLPGLAERSGAADRLAGYVRRCRGDLDRQPTGDLLNGKVRFSNPTSSPCAAPTDFQQA